MMSKQDFKNCKLMLINEDGTCIIEQITNVQEDIVETKNRVVPRYVEFEHEEENEEVLKMYVDNVSGTVYYTMNLDVPGLIESEKLKMLRRTSTLQNIFSYDVPKKDFSLLGFMPWVAIILLIFFSR